MPYKPDSSIEQSFEDWMLSLPPEYRWGTNEMTSDSWQFQDEAGQAFILDVEKQEAVRELELRRKLKDMYGIPIPAHLLERASTDG